MDGTAGAWEVAGRAGGDCPLAGERAARWAEMLAHAQQRPAMFIGPQETAHLYFLRAPMRLLWQARVLRRPVRVRVDLSPHRCAVRCESGPLIRPVQAMFSFPGGPVLGDAWEDERRAYFSDYFSRVRDDRDTPADERRFRRGWRYCFSGPTGPRLAEPSYPSLLARRLVWGVRTAAGLWCQAYAGGWPVGAPFLRAGPSPVGLFVLADLDPAWFTGLPYTPGDAARVQAASHRPQGGGQRTAWSTGEVVAEWHGRDDLVTDEMVTDGVLPGEGAPT